jgi:hypothetical protein
LIYLHHTTTKVAGVTSEDFEILDGQQRIATKPYLGVWCHSNGPDAT